MLALAKYVPVNKSSPDYVPPKYDHVTCFVMKARYNCAHKNPDSFYEKGYEPNDWKMVLQSQQSDDDTPEEVCDLPALAESMGGPKGFANYLLQNSQATNTNTVKKTFGVILIGDSRLRQIWEALVCAWQEDITNITLQLNGTAPTAGTNYTRTMGSLVSPTVDYLRANGCHSDSGRGGVLDQFYEENMTVPPSLLHCDDDIAMVEFDHRIRFYYFSRPNQLHPNFQQAVDALLGPDVDIENEIDQLIFASSFATYVRKNLQWNTKFPYLWENMINWHMPKLKEIVERDAGRWFGVDNRWITDIPNDEYHGCMPGFPDDEVNLLLYMLVVRQQQQQQQNGSSLQELFNF